MRKAELVAALAAMKIRAERAEKLAAALPAILTNLQTLATGVVDFMGSVNSFVEFIGGWEAALGALAVLMSGPLILAITQLGIALAATPVGWVIAGLVAITAAGWLLYKNWDTIWRSISDVVGGTIEQMIMNFESMVPDWMKGMFGGGSTTVNANTKPTQTAQSLTPQAGQAGNAAVTVDFKNLPPGTSVKPTDNTGVNLNLGMGFAMQGAY